MRVILYTGKGGVGKTSVAAATAIRSAELGYKTVALSTDIAHSLADSLETQLSNTPKEVVPNLWGQQSELSEAIKTNWQVIQGYISSLLTWKGMDEITADEMAILPGMDELANLLYIVHLQDEKKYDVAIVDCAPTGETLRLLSFPEMLHWWMTRMFPIGKKVVSMVQPLASTLMRLPLPSSEVMDSVQQLYEELEQVRTLLTDREKSSVRLVVNPEKMVIQETQRTFTYLNLYGYHTDLVICNRMIPEKVGGAYFQGWKDSQKKYLQVIKETFSPLPIFNVPLMDQEIVGIPMLRRMSAALYGDKDPTDVFFKGLVQEVRKVSGHYVLTLALPFVSKEKLSMMQNGDELTIQVADFRRKVLLPHILKGKNIEEAKLEADKLKITFEPEKEDKKSQHRGGK
jgi:arsenite-transporting ATPase